MLGHKDFTFQSDRRTHPAQRSLLTRNKPNVMLVLKKKKKKKVSGFIVKFRKFIVKVCVTLNHSDIFILVSGTVGSLAGIQRWEMGE